MSINVCGYISVPEGRPRWHRAPSVCVCSCGFWGAGNPGTFLFVIFSSFVIQVCDSLRHIGSIRGHYDGTAWNMPFIPALCFSSSVLMFQHARIWGKKWNLDGGPDRGNPPHWRGNDWNDSVCYWYEAVDNWGFVRKTPSHARKVAFRCPASCGVLKVSPLWHRVWWWEHSSMAALSWVAQRLSVVDVPHLRVLKPRLEQFLWGRQDSVEESLVEKWPTGQRSHTVSLTGVP